MKEYYLFGVDCMDEIKFYGGDADSEWVELKQDISFDEVMTFDEKGAISMQDFLNITHDLYCWYIGVKYIGAK